MVLLLLFTSSSSSSSWSSSSSSLSSTLSKMMNIVLFTLTIHVIFSNASCLRNGKPLCCSGRQPECHEFHYLHNQFLKCFCDENCVRERNCCWDYPIACLNDCVVSTWSSWQTCNNDCGQGTQGRTRFVIKSPLRGGKPCPYLNETRVCQKYSCRKHPIQASNATLRRVIMKTETANLLPMQDGVQKILRGFDMRYDRIRRHLYERNIKMRQSEQMNEMPYCAVYQVKRASAFCSPRTAQRLQLRTGQSSNNEMLSSWLKHVNSLRAEEHICVTCFQYYMHDRLGEQRCLGTGIKNETTKWRASLLPHCSGFFKLVETMRGCTCPTTQSNSFVFQ